MNNYTKSIDEVIHYLSKLPSIGRKSATKMALKILEMDDDFTIEFAKSLINMKKNTHHCKICGNLSENEICEICENEKRDREVICVVEGVRDVIAFEKSETYNGLYHVLGGKIDPLNGVTIEDLNLKLGDVVELEGVVITWSNVAGGTYKIFADAIKRVDGVQQGNVPKQHENKGKEEHKG